MAKIKGKLQVPVSKENLKNFDSLKDKLGFKTRRELFENALWFIESIADRIEQGGTPLIEYEDEIIVELTSPWIERIKKQKTQTH